MPFALSPQTIDPARYEVFSSAFLFLFFHLSIRQPVSRSLSLSLLSLFGNLGPLLCHPRHASFCFPAPLTHGIEADSVAWRQVRASLVFLRLFIKEGRRRSRRRSRGRRKRDKRNIPVEFRTWARARSCYGQGDNTAARRFLSIVKPIVISKCSCLTREMKRDVLFFLLFACYSAFFFASFTLMSNSGTHCTPPLPLPSPPLSSRQQGSFPVLAKKQPSLPPNLPSFSFRPIGMFPTISLLISGSRERKEKKNPTDLSVLVPFFVARR